MQQRQGIEEQAESLNVEQTQVHAFDRDSMVTVVDLSLSDGGQEKINSPDTDASFKACDSINEDEELTKIKHEYDEVYEPPENSTEFSLASTDGNGNGGLQVEKITDGTRPLVEDNEEGSLGKDSEETYSAEGFISSNYEEPIIPRFPLPDQLETLQETFLAYELGKSMSPRHESQDKTSVMLPQERPVVKDKFGYEYVMCPFCPDHQDQPHSCAHSQFSKCETTVVGQSRSYEYAVCEVCVDVEEKNEPGGEYDELWFKRLKPDSDFSHEYGKLDKGLDIEEPIHEVALTTGHIYNLYDDKKEKLQEAREDDYNFYLGVDDDEIYEEIRSPKFGFTEVVESEATIFWSSDTSSGESGDDLAAKTPRDDGLAQRHGTLGRDKTPKSFLQKIQARTRKNDQYDPQQARERAKKKIEEEEHLIPDVRLLTTRHPPPKLPNFPDGLSDNQVLRRKIVGQIVETENSYANSLTRLIEDYELPLLDANPPFVNQSKVKTMFYRVRSILQCHVMFRIGLAQSVSKWDTDEKIGDVFVGCFSKAFIVDIYSDFVNNFTVAVETARRLSKQKPLFAEFMKSKQVMAKDRLSFFGLMVKPVQRFPQYILLLQDLLKNTPNGHHDRVSLQMALTTLESLAEKLNQRKLDSEQRLAVKQILRNMNVKFSLKSVVEGTRFFVREDSVMELILDENSGSVTMKPRKLILMNDMLICAALKKKAPEERHEQRGRYSLKFSVPLQDVTIIDNVAYSGIHAARMKGSRLSLVSASDSTYSGSASISSASTISGMPVPGSITSKIHVLYHELNSLVHDFTVISQIGGLVSTLYHPLPGLNHDVLHNICQKLQKEIQTKDDEIASFNCCRVNISLPAKSRSQSKMYFTFDMSTPKAKKEWLTDLHMCQVALDPSNCSAWDIADGNDDSKTRSKLPLFVLPLPVFMGKEATEVRCGVFCPANPLAGVPRDQVWVCSSGRGVNSITVISLHKTHPELSHSFEVASQNIVQCMEMVPRETFTTVWLGTDQGQILMYKINKITIHNELVSFVTPGGVGVTKMVHTDDRVFVALASGQVAIYKKSMDGHWKTESATMICLSNNTVTDMLLLDDTLWCSCGRKIFLIDIDTEIVQRNFLIHNDKQMSAGKLCKAGIGVWCTINATPLVRLFHSETYQLLQELNISSAVSRLLGERDQSKSRVSVSSIMASSGYLWIGTSVGILVVYSLPRLEGVPVISNKALVSYHSHKSAVTMLLSCLPTQACMQPLKSELTSPPKKSSSGDNQRQSMCSAYDNQKKQSPPTVLAKNEEEDTYSTAYDDVCLPPDTQAPEKEGECEDEHIYDVADEDASKHIYVNYPVEKYEHEYDLVYDASVNQPSIAKENVPEDVIDEVFEEPYAISDIPGKLFN